MTPSNWTCVAPDASTTNCSVISYAYATSTATTTQALTHAESLFVIMVFVVLLSPPFFRFLFGSWGK